MLKSLNFLLQVMVRHGIFSKAMRRLNLHLRKNSLVTNEFKADETGSQKTNYKAVTKVPIRHNVGFI